MTHSLWLRPFPYRLFGHGARKASRNRRRVSSRQRVRPCLEVLEDRTVPATFNVGAGDVTTLIADINTANSNGDTSNTINLTSSTYDLKTVNNDWYGPDGLPPITSNLTINGNGATIQRDTSPSTADFRLFYVSGGLSGELPLGSLTLVNLTLQGGIAKGGDSGFGGGGLGAGGAIFNQGTLDLIGVTATNNQAQGGGGGVSLFGNILGSGGGGMGEDAPNASGEINQGGGFGSGFPSGYGGTGGINGQFYSGGQLSGYSGGGGGGFLAGANGQNGSPAVGGNGGGLGSFGGSAGQGGGSGGIGGDGGGGGWGPVFQGFGPVGGNFGYGGQVLSGGGVGGGGGGAAYVSGGQFTYDTAGGGGFGGGGGGGGSAGAGGFGGGGGGANTSGGGTPGSGGFGGGKGGSDGGGGAGMGGSIFSMLGTLTLTNCTLTGNTAVGGSSNGGTGGSGLGGAVFNLNGQLQITFSTLAHNAVSDGSGGHPLQAAGTDVYNLADGNNIINGSAVTATTFLTDSILSNPQSGSDLWSFSVNGNHTNTATVNLNGQNVVMYFGAAITGSPPITSDPQLGSLQNNGGLTETMAIPVNSPALNAGTAVPGIIIDQRGQPRPSSDPSLGSYEPQFATTTDAFDATATFSQSAQNVALSADVLNVGPGNVNGGTVTFTVKQGNTVIGSPVTSGTVNDNSAGATYVLPANTQAGSYTIDAVYNPGGGFQGSSDTTHTLTVNAAATAMVVADTSSTYNESPQSVTLTANVSSGAGTVNEGTVTFTLKQGSTVIGSAVTTGTLSNGQASVTYVLPAGISVGRYTIEADYNDSAGNFLPGNGHAAQKINAASEALDLTTVQIVPNLLNGTAQVTLTARTSSPAGGVNQGVVSFTLAGVSGQGGVNNGTTSVQLVVPLLALSSNQAIAVAYADNATPANFTGGNIAKTLYLNNWDVFFPSNLSFVGGVEVNAVNYYGLPYKVYYNGEGGFVGNSLGFVSTDPGNGGAPQYTANFLGWPLVIYIDFHELAAIFQFTAAVLYPPQPTEALALLYAVSHLYPPDPIWPPNPLVTAVQLSPYDFYYEDGILTGITGFNPPEIP